MPWTCPLLIPPPHHTLPHPLPCCSLHSTRQQSLRALLLALCASVLLLPASASLVVEKEWSGPHIQGQPLLVTFHVTNLGPGVVSAFALNDKSFANTSAYRSNASPDGSAKFRLEDLKV